MSQLVFLGAPGSGKGTQAKRLVEEKGYEHVSTGDLLRREVHCGTKLGEKVSEILRRGELVEDGLVLELLEANCDLHAKNYIFDGFPRNIDQARLLTERLLKNYAHRGIYFNMPVEKLVERLKNRQICRTCNAVYNVRSMPPKETGVCDHCGESSLYQRDDDEEVAIRTRLNIYHDTIWPVLEYYRSQHILLEVVADQDPGQVFNGLLQALA